uniref:J domain-containing protein n=1 Tax=Chrysotila carterae TaxID=13221 RepID=A0A7S4B2T0_CHRCT
MAASTKPIRLLLLFLLLECGVGLDFEGFFGGGPQGAGAAPGGGRGADREYYDLLGVDPGCTEADLKRAWRKLSLKNHPDRGGDAERFKQLNEAYQVLSDPQKRAAYDRFGKAAVDGSAPGPGPGGMDGGEGMGGGFPGGFAGFSGMGGFGGMGGMGGFGGMGGGVNLEELLNALNQGMRGQRTPQVLQVQVTLEELYTGAEKRLVVRTRALESVARQSTEGRTQPATAATRISLELLQVQRY